MSVDSIFSNNAKILQSKTAIKWHDKEVIFGKLDSSSNRLVRVWQSRGIVKGDRVCIFVQNPLEFVIAHFAFAGKKVDISPPCDLWI